MFTLSSFNFIFSQFRFVSQYLTFSTRIAASTGASGGKSASTCRIEYIRGFTTFRPTLTCSFMTVCKTRFMAGERWNKMISAKHSFTTLHTWLYTADSSGLLACRSCLERIVVLFCSIFMTWRITCCFFPIVWHSMVRSWQYRTVGQTGQGRLILICLKLCRRKVKTEKTGSHLILRGDKGYHILLELEII